MNYIIGGQINVPHAFPSRAMNIRSRTSDEVDVCCSSNISCLFIIVNSKNVFTCLQLGHLCGCPEGCVVRIAQHRFGIVRISCIDCSFVLKAISQMVEIMIMMTGIVVFRGFRERNRYSEGREKRKTHRQLKAYGSCKLFEFFQIQFYGRVVGVVVFPMP
jgi:hypothetical protein